MKKLVLATLITASVGLSSGAYAAPSSHGGKISFPFASSLLSNIKDNLKSFGQSVGFGQSKTHRAHGGGGGGGGTCR
jgi:hypothetical protein